MSPKLSPTLFPLPNPKSRKIHNSTSETIASLQDQVSQLLTHYQSLTIAVEQLQQGIQSQALTPQKSITEKLPSDNQGETGDRTTLQVIHPESEVAQDAPENESKQGSLESSHGKLLTTHPAYNLARERGFDKSISTFKRCSPQDLQGLGLAKVERAPNKKNNRDPSYQDIW